MSATLSILAVWSGFGLAWWTIALVLVTAGQASRRRGRHDGTRLDRRRISVFKPLASPRSREELERLRRCLESFVAELDDRSELLVGGAEADRAQLARLLDSIRARYPRASLRLVTHAHPDQYANRKISLMKGMAAHATGDIWFWSDADMEAPPGALRSLREDFAAGDAGGSDAPGFVTSPYVVGGTGGAREMLDKLFVNLEFYPGVLLLGRLNLIHFAFGSGIAFEAARFRRRVDWDDLGSHLADDYRLGCALGPGRLASTRLKTVPHVDSWREALLHYLRWHKTIRWCRPGSYASQLLVLPVLGWLLAVLVYPGETAAWGGLAGMVALETAAAYAVCAALGARPAWHDLPAVGAWSVTRAVAWAACWLPWPIVWRGQKWWTHTARAAPHQLDSTSRSASRQRVSASDSVSRG